MKKNITFIENINQISSDVISNFENKNNFEISFDKDSNKPIQNFINQNISEIYLDTNYKIDINLSDENFDLFIFLIDCIENAFNKILNNKTVNKELFGNIFLWNISICSNIFFNFPFTLEDIIYLPLNYIQQCYNINNISNKLIETLIHEKLHVGQRYNELIWEKYINQNDSNWIKVIKSDYLYKIINNIISNQTLFINKKKYILISNPDTWYLNFKYIYKTNDNLLYGQYFYDIELKTIEKKYFKINKYNNNFKNSEYKLEYKLEALEKEDSYEFYEYKLEEEHPYEFYAYKIASDIMNYH